MDQIKAFERKDMLKQDHRWRRLVI